MKKNKSKLDKTLQSSTLSERKKICYDIIANSDEIFSKEWERTLVFGAMMSSLQWAFGDPAPDVVDDYDQPP